MLKKIIKFIFSVNNIDEHKAFCFLGIKIKIKNHYRKVLKYINSFIPEGFTDICIIKQDMGEPYVLANSMSEFTKKMNIKKIFFVFGRKYHADIFKMYYNDINYVCIPNIIPMMWDGIPNKVYRYKNKRFILYINQQYTRSIMKKISTNKLEIPMINAILKNYNIKRENVSFSYPKFSDEIINGVEQKVKEMGLKREKFIVLCPETTSLAKYDKDFWLDISQKLIAQGYDIYYNNFKNLFKIEGAKELKLNTQEFTYLVTLSKGVISIRTGLVEVISQINVPLYILYTPFRGYKLNSTKSLQTYSLHHYPNVIDSNIYEFKTDVQTKEDIISMILNDLSQRERSNK